MNASRALYSYLLREFQQLLDAGATVRAISHRHDCVRVFLCVFECESFFSSGVFARVSADVSAVCFFSAAASASVVMATHRKKTEDHCIDNHHITTAQPV